MAQQTMHGASNASIGSAWVRPDGYGPEFQNHPDPVNPPPAMPTAQWAQQMPPQSDTPLDEPLQKATLSKTGDHDNISTFGVDDFRMAVEMFKDRVKVHFTRLDDLGSRFATKENFFAIHREISKAINGIYNIWIPKQTDTEFSQHLANAYQSFYNINMRTGDVNRDLYNLNKMIVETALNNMLGNIRLTYNQVTMIDRVPTPMPPPTNVNNRGLDGRSNLDITRFLPLAEIFPEQIPSRVPLAPSVDAFGTNFGNSAAFGK